MKTTLDLPDEVIPAVVIHDINGLPVVRCGQNAPAKQMSLSELLKLEQMTQTITDLHTANTAV